MVISKQRRSHIFLGFAQNQGLQASLCQLRGFAPYLMICSGGDQWDDDDEEEEGAQWARRPDNEKHEIKNKALKNSGR